MDLRSPRKGEAMRKEELRRRRNKTVSYKKLSDVRVFERRNAHTKNTDMGGTGDVDCNQSRV